MFIQNSIYTVEELQKLSSKEELVIKEILKNFLKLGEECSKDKSIDFSIGNFEEFKTNVKAVESDFIKLAAIYDDIYNKEFNND